MKIIKNKIAIDELKKYSENSFGNLIKGVVDIELEVIALFGEMHVDEETLLIDNGSKQEHLWGINIYPELEGDNMLEFDSMINLRPSQGNMSRSVDDPKIRKRIIEIINKLIVK